MTYWDYINKIKNERVLPRWIDKVILRYSSQIENHTSFLDGIPDEYKMRETIVLFTFLREYDECTRYDISSESKKIPRDLIARDIETVERMNELINRYNDNNNFVHVGELTNHELNDAFKQDIETFLSIIERIEHDLKIMQQSKKTTKSDTLMLLRKRAYYANEVKKDDIENAIRDILQEHSLEVDFLSIRKFISVI